jgi:hypothetical protein
VAWRVHPADAAQFAAEGQHCQVRRCRNPVAVVSWRWWRSTAAGRVSAPTEALGLVPNYDRRPRERFDIRPCGTEAHARRHRRHGEKPCPACLTAENHAHAYRHALRTRAAHVLPEPAEEDR